MPILEQSEEYNVRIHFWNKVYRIALLGLVVMVLAIAGLGVRKVYVISNKLDRTTQAIRNTQTQGQATKYIKCIALIRFDVPAEQLQTRDGSEAALDNCAKAQ